jgi:hypothetical protein
MAALPGAAAVAARPPSQNGHQKPDLVGAAVKAVANVMEYRPEGDAFRGKYAKLTEDKRRDMAGNLLLQLEQTHADMCLRRVTLAHRSPAYTTGNPERGERQRLLTDRTEVNNVRQEQLAILDAQIAATEAQIRALHAHPVWGALLLPKPEPELEEDGMEIETLETVETPALPELQDDPAPQDQG